MSRFPIPTWTRRRAGFAAGGLAVALLRTIRPDGAAASNRNTRKKRCKELGTPCRPDGRRCCKGRTCGGPPEARFCCKQGGEPCKKSKDCCNLTCERGSCALN